MTVACWGDGQAFYTGQHPQTSYVRVVGVSNNDGLTPRTAPCGFDHGGVPPESRNRPRWKSSGSPESADRHAAGPFLVSDLSTCSVSGPRGCKNVQILCSFSSPR